jgi:hypothetical protein
MVSNARVVARNPTTPLMHALYARQRGSNVRPPYLARYMGFGPPGFPTGMFLVGAIALLLYLSKDFNKRD